MSDLEQNSNCHPNLWRQLKMRLPRNHHDEVKAYCKKNNIKISHLMRNGLYEIMHGGTSVASELLEIKRQLSAIGNNLNQIAKHANATHEIGTIENIDRNLSDMREELRKVLKKVWR